MKLGDVLPHWLFREKAGINAEIGVSAFAHLREAAYYVTINSGLGITADPAAWLVDPATGGPSIDIEPGYIALWAAAASDYVEASRVSSDLGNRYERQADGTQLWSSGDGSPDDASLGRSAAGVLAFTDVLEGREVADPAAPGANKGRLYFKDVGGKTALMARFPTGAVQQIAVEP